MNKSNKDEWTRDFIFVTPLSMLSSAIRFFRNFFSNDDKFTENLKILQKKLSKKGGRKKKKNTKRLLSLIASLNNPCCIKLMKHATILSLCDELNGVKS